MSRNPRHSTKLHPFMTAERVAEHPSDKSGATDAATKRR